MENRDNKENKTMPVRKVSGGYKYGTQGKLYATKADATRQGRAINAAKKTKRKGAQCAPKKRG